jgi:hypothetical protein
MEGISDCIAVLPAAATNITANSKANRPRERPKPPEVEGGEAGASIGHPLVIPAKAGT